MANKGVVKWYNPDKGYGFIVPDNGGKDVFVHVTALEKAGLRSLNEGDRIEFDTEQNKGKTAAVNVRKAA